MYAVTQTVAISDRAAAEAGLGHVVPQVSGLPGFVAGYWMARDANQGLALVVFDSEEGARSFADFLKVTPGAPGVAPDRERIDVCEVFASV